MSEPDKQLSLSASLVKTLTGNDTVSARFLGENSFEFKPQFKIFINTNHLPYVSDSEQIIIIIRRRRICMLNGATEKTLLEVKNYLREFLKKSIS